MKRKLLGAALLLAGLALLAAGTTGVPASTALGQTKPAPAATAPAPVIVTEADDGKTVTVELGQEVQIALDGQISTGHSWSVTATTGNAVKQNGKVTITSKRPPGGGPRVGTMDEFKAKFDTVNHGTSTVSMEYKQPWNKNAPPAKSFKVTLKVVPKLGKGP